MIQLKYIDFQTDYRKGVFKKTNKLLLKYIVQISYIILFKNYCNTTLTVYIFCGTINLATDFYGT